jgi:hypothetical protein
MTATSLPDLYVSGDLTPNTAVFLLISGTLATSIIDAWEGSTIVSSVRVKLAGQWVPGDELIAVSWRCSIDTPQKAATITLAAKRNSIWQSLRSWTLQDVEVWDYQGPLGQPIATLELRGAVIPGARQVTKGDGSDVEVTFEVDDIGAYSGNLCIEVSPGTNLPRGEFARQFAVTAGLTTTSIPDGDIFDRAIVAADRSLFDTLKDVGVAQNWSWRIVPLAAGGVKLEAYTPELKEAPLAPDAIWTPDDWQSISVDSPDRPASRVIVRGLVAVSVDEAGIETEINKVTIEEVFSLDRAVEEQLTTGVINSLGDLALETTGRTAVITTETRRKAGKELSVFTREEGYRSPRGAALHTPEPGSPDGPAPDGYYYARSYIYSDGEYRYWRNARWGDKSERRLYNYYNSSGQVSSTKLQEFGWYSRTAGVRATIVDSWVVGVGVGSDDQSYNTVRSGGGRYQIEDYGLFRETYTQYTRNDDGVVTDTRSQVYEYHGIRSAIDISGQYLRYDGTAQTEIVANWKKSKETSLREEISDGLVLSRTQSESGYFLILKGDGGHDFGNSEFSSRASAIYRRFRNEVTIYRYLVNGRVEVLTISSDGSPVTEIVDQAPAAQYEISPWTTMRQDMAEAVWEDVGILAAFGEHIEAINTDYLTSPEQALEVAGRLALRSRARRVRVVRLATYIREGHTVLLIDRDQGLMDRGLVVDLDVSIDVQSGVKTASYVLEVY